MKDPEWVDIAQSWPPPILMIEYDEYTLWDLQGTIKSGGNLLVLSQFKKA